MNHQQDNSIKYRNMSLLVRPARVAVLIPKNDEFWKHIIIRVFEWCSKVWGGAYFLIVPTDGKEIKTAFWKILEEYSPDHVASFMPTFQDLEFAEPKRYNEIIAKYKASFFQQFPEFSETDFQDYVERDINPSSRYEFKIEDQLQQQIKQRLTPFYFNDHIVQERISAQSHVPFPLTQLEQIVNQGGLEKVYVVDEIDDIDCSLVFHSNWGLYRSKFEKALIEKGVKVSHLPKEARLADLLQFSVNKHVDTTEIKFRKQFYERKGEKDTSWYPDEDIALFSPYESSLLKVGKYKSFDPYEDEPVSLIIGDTIEDFCLYYSLSRIQDAVYWMPEVQVPTKGSDPTPRTIISAAIARAAINKIRYGHTKNDILISSLSLPKEELEKSREQLLKLGIFAEEFGQRILIEPSLWTLKKSTFRLIEQNNYTNLYTEVFQNNKGVGRVPTPKPKNFGQVVPYDHRWVTEINIEGYTPPQLHFLGKEIVDLRESTNETRVSKTGICYTCPNRAYFGGDIDVTLVRPRINIIEPLTIFQKYFAEAGYVDVRLSDKGAYAKETIEKFGSLDEVGSFLQIQKNRDLLSLFISKKSSSSQENGDVVYANGRAYIDFKAIEYLMGNQEQAIHLIDNFIVKGILYRGTMLQCSLCREADWYGLAELDQTFICHRCKQTQTIQKQNWKDGKEPAWFYKLDEIIYQGVKNDMVLPLLTLTHLKKNAKFSFLFVPELEFRRDPHASKPEREICFL